jgi:hypothetical protein
LLKLLDPDVLLKLLDPDVLLKLLDLPFDGTLSTENIPRILPGASRNQQGASTEAMTDTVLTQPSNIRKAVNSGATATAGLLTLLQALQDLSGMAS